MNDKPNSGLIDFKIGIVPLVMAAFQIVTLVFIGGIYYNSSKTTQDDVKEIKATLADIVRVVPLTSLEVTNEEKAIEDLKVRQSNLAVRVGATETNFASMNGSLTRIQSDITDLLRSTQDNAPIRYPRGK
jgi:hypothetical protein